MLRRGSARHCGQWLRHTLPEAVGIPAQRSATKEREHGLGGPWQAQAKPSVPGHATSDSWGATPAARLMARMGLAPEPAARPSHPSLEQLRLPFDS